MAYTQSSNEVEIQQFQPILENSRELELKGWMVVPTYGHSRAGLTWLAGRMRPAGRQLDNAGLLSCVAAKMMHGLGRF